MTSPHQSPRTFRTSHDGVCIVFGLVAAATAIASAVLVFGPLADQRVLAMSGSASRSDPGVAAASTPLRVASSERLADR